MSTAAVDTRGTQVRAPHQRHKICQQSRGEMRAGRLRSGAQWFCVFDSGAPMCPNVARSVKCQTTSRARSRLVPYEREGEAHEANSDCSSCRSIIAARVRWCHCAMIVAAKRCFPLCLCLQQRHTLPTTGGPKRDASAWQSRRCVCICGLMPCAGVR